MVMPSACPWMRIVRDEMHKRLTVLLSSPYRLFPCREPIRPERPGWNRWLRAEDQDANQSNRSGQWADAVRAVAGADKKTFGFAESAIPDVAAWSPDRGRDRRRPVRVGPVPRLNPARHGEHAIPR